MCGSFVYNVWEVFKCHSFQVSVFRLQVFKFFSVLVFKFPFSKGVSGVALEAHGKGFYIGTCTTTTATIQMALEKLPQWMENSAMHLKPSFIHIHDSTRFADSR